MKKWLWSGVLILLAIFIVCYFFRFIITPYKELNTVSYKIIPGKSPGWGFTIYVDGKLYIRQDVIPAIGGNRSFREKAQAESVARLMIHKMQTEVLPTVTKHELDSLGVLK